MKKILGFGGITFLYMILALFSLYVIIYGITLADPKDDFLKGGVPTLIALIFGASGKSLYQILVQAPFNFDKERFEASKERKNIFNFTLLFFDFISGIAIMIYVFKIAPLLPTFVVVSMIIFSILLAIIFILSFIFDSKNNSKETKMRQRRYRRYRRRYRWKLSIS